jgi:hypothetical protein
MRIGNQIHTANNKKVYRKPVLESVDVDRVIVLQNPTILPEDPFPTSSNNSISGFEETTEKDKIFPESNDPFGGGTPNYDYDR